MRLEKFIIPLFLFILLANHWVRAGQFELKAFVPGSYQKIVSEQGNRPFMMVVWSINCSSCLKDMVLLNKIYKSQSGLRIVMLATDGVAANSQVQAILEKNELASVENWNYADDNSQKLQYEIDPAWYGELPRTYFFDKSQRREGVSGVLTEADYLGQIKKITQ